MLNSTTPPTAELVTMILGTFESLTMMMRELKKRADIDPQSDAQIALRKVAGE